MQLLARLRRERREPIVIAIKAGRRLAPGVAMAAFALRWVLMAEAVTCAIPGVKRPTQVKENVAAAELPALPADTMAAVQRLYDARIRPLVHPYW